MKRVAIFVDAGYLYAQGSVCLQANKAKRENLKLDHLQFVKFLKSLAADLQPSAPLLRIYWYDGTSRGPTLDHRTLADLDDVKLRLGFINSVGKQKGVDSLLVTDLVELSRNGAICDAVLLGGDEDLRIGVQIAQSFGVRLHLLGVEPSRGSQSLQLRQETDTKQEITADEVKTFLSVAYEPSSPIVIPIFTPAETSLALAASEGSAVTLSFESSLDSAIGAVIERMKPVDLEQLAKALKASSIVPSMYDGRMLASCRTVLGRDLLADEKKLARSRFISKVQAFSNVDQS